MLVNSRIQSIIWTARITEAEKFYRDVLGLCLRAWSDGAMVFKVGYSDLRVAPVPSTKPTEHTVLGFAVDNVDATVAWLIDRGIVIERFEHFRHEDNGAFTTPDGARVAWFRGPDGNLLSVFEEQAHLF